MHPIRVIKKKIRDKVRYLNTLSTHNFKIKDITSRFNAAGDYSFSLEGGIERSIVWFEAEAFLYLSAEEVWDIFRDEMYNDLAIDLWQEI